MRAWPEAEVMGTGRGDRFLRMSRIAHQRASATRNGTVKSVGTVWVGWRSNSLQPH
jgi:hypothetical protein